MKKILLIVFIILIVCDSLFFGIVIDKHNLLESKGILGLVFIIGIGFNILAIIILILTILFLSKSYNKIYNKLDNMEENNDVRHKQTQEIILDIYEEDHMEKKL